MSIPLPINRIIRHNVVDLWPLPDKCVHCIVTSLPYWGLRDYKVEGQLGREKTPEEFIANMVKVFREAKRVLRDDGTLWVNIGDSYAHNGAAYGSRKPTLNGRRQGEVEFGSAIRFIKEGAGLKPKDLVGIPWMLAFALRADGWYLRQDIIWHKPNPMPASTQDRCTKSHEYVFLLSKSPRYYFDAFSIATPYKDKTLTTFGIESKGHGDGSGLIQSENWSLDVKVRKPKEWKTPDNWDTSEGAHGAFHRNGREKGKTVREKAAQKDEVGGRGFIGHSGNFDAAGELIGSGKANKRSVWTVATSPFKKGHFATFPPKLIVDCIKAGCAPDGIVLGPFMGAGTTALVASLNGRKYIGLELSPDYITLAEKRLKKELGMFANPDSDVFTSGPEY